MYYNERIENYNKKIVNIPMFLNNNIIKNKGNNDINVYIYIYI